jgi:hypothetical protein
VTVARRVGGQDLAPTTSERAQARAQELLGGGDEAMLVLVYQDPTGHLVEVRERVAMGQALPNGQPVTVHGQAGVLAQQGDREVLAFVLEGTLVEVSGSADRAGWVALANALQPTTLAPFETTAAGQAMAAATPPAWTRLPLSARLGPAVPAKATRAEIAQQCAWNASAASMPPGQAMLQVHCAARLAAGITDEQGGWGYDLSPWHEAATRLGVDPVRGPGGDPQVYLVQLDVSEHGGMVVVLDAATAEPYLVAPLRSAS